MTWNYITYLNSLFFNLKDNFYIKSHVYLLWCVYLNVHMTKFIPKGQKGRKIKYLNNSGLKKMTLTFISSMCLLWAKAGVVLARTTWRTAVQIILSQEAALSGSCPVIVRKLEKYWNQPVEGEQELDENKCFHVRVRSDRSMRRRLSRCTWIQWPGSKDARPTVYIWTYMKILAAVEDSIPSL